MPGDGINSPSRGASQSRPALGGRRFSVTALPHGEPLAMSARARQIKTTAQHGTSALKSRMCIFPTESGPTSEGESYQATTSFILHLHGCFLDAFPGSPQQRADTSVLPHTSRPTDLKIRRCLDLALVQFTTETHFYLLSHPRCKIITSYYSRTQAQGIHS